MKNHFADPGHYMANLYSTDGYQPHSTVQQLYVNLVYPDSYTYSVFSSEAKLFQLFNEEFSARSEKYQPNSLSQPAGQPAFDLKSIVMVIQCEAQAWCEKMVTNLETINDVEELCRAFEFRYLDYINCMVVLENSLPALSLILASARSPDFPDFPSSLWQLCFAVFKKNVLNSKQLDDALKGCLALLLRIRKLGLKARTANAGDHKPALALDVDIETVHSFGCIMEDLSVDESSVLKLEEEFWYNDCYAALVAAIQEQTQMLYRTELAKASQVLGHRAIKHDLATLSRLFLPCALTKATDEAQAWDLPFLESFCTLSLGPCDQTNPKSVLTEIMNKQGSFAQREGGPRCVESGFRITN